VNRLAVVVPAQELLPSGLAGLAAAAGRVDPARRHGRAGQTYLAALAAEISAG
jgi:hypothetical protein